MNRRTFLKSLAGVAAAIGMPLPAIEAIAQLAETAPIETIAPALDTGYRLLGVDLIHKVHSGEYFTFGSRTTTLTTGAVSVTLTKRFVENGTQYTTKSYLDGSPNTAVIERLKNEDFSDFVEYERITSYEQSA